jgi:hypothetical protein
MVADEDMSRANTLYLVMDAQLGTPEEERVGRPATEGGAAHQLELECRGQGGHVA